jgi:hypothetical protein
MQLDDPLILSRARAAENCRPRGTESHAETMLACERVPVSERCCAATPTSGANRRCRAAIRTTRLARR